MVKYIKLGGMLVALVLVASILFAWRSAREEQIKLAAELKVTQQALNDANERQKARDEALTEQLKKLAEKKAAVKTPAQALKALPSVLPLPVPLAFDESEAARATPGAQSRVTVPPENSGRANALPGSAPIAKAEMPVADLKPLYDFAVDCRACQARLLAAEANLKDEQVKTQALGRERDDALKMAKGGSVTRRIMRAAKWFAIGAAAGAVAVKLAR
jgi:hypothetical protein